MSDQGEGEGEAYVSLERDERKWSYVRVCVITRYLSCWWRRLCCLSIEWADRRDEDNGGLSYSRGLMA